MSKVKQAAAETEVKTEKQMNIDLNVARKVLETIDKGLVRGVGIREPGKMCVEAAVCYALDLPHGDDPGCVSMAVRALKINLNDRNWSSDQARANGLRRLGLAQLGSKGAISDIEFAQRISKYAIQKQVPAALRSAASIQKDQKHREALIQAAFKCESYGSKASAAEARAAANAAYAANAADAAAYAANAAAYAAAYAANAANAADAAANAANAAYAANAVAYAAVYAAADAANAAVYAAADAANAANAADAAANAACAANAAANAACAARDKLLAEFAEDVVQILIDMKAPGCQWLALTEIAA